MASYPYITHLAREAWLSDGPLSEMLDVYIEGLEARRYKPRTIIAYLRCLAHFSHWMQGRRLRIASIDHALIEHFIAHHLPSCTCPPPCRSVVSETRAALHHLLKLLPHDISREGVIATPIDIELKRFGDHLRDACGLSPQTIFYRMRHVRAFLAGRFGTDQPKISELGAKDIDDFLERLADRWKPASCKVVCTNLRSYFRYRAMLGDDTRVLCAILPPIANWPRRHPPHVLSDGQLEQSLPLPAQAGKALIHYLQEGRPQTTNRAMFVRHRAPFGVPLSVAAIRNAMNRAFVRCGLADQFCNTHILRRTAATRLQKAGVSVKAIADVLRHRDLNTARVYARVDLEHLRAVAQPWPGGES